MELFENFAFGKYKGLTLLEVFQGTDSINKNLLKHFVNYRLLHPTVNELVLRSSHPFGQGLRAGCLKYEVGDTVIQVTGQNGADILEDITTDLNAFFIEEDDFIKIKFTKEFGLDDINMKLVKVKDSILYVANGQPTYLEWCIEEIDGFYVHPKSLEVLKKTEVNYFAGLNFIREFKSIYRFESSVIKKIFSFSEKIIRINNEKHNNFVDYMDDILKGRKDIHGNELTNGHVDVMDYDYDDDTSFYSGESTCACGESPCMCSDPVRW